MFKIFLVSSRNNKQDEKERKRKTVDQIMDILKIF